MSDESQFRVWRLALFFARFVLKPAGGAVVARGRHGSRREQARDAFEARRAALLGLIRSGFACIACRGLRVLLEISTRAVVARGRHGIRRKQARDAFEARRTPLFGLIFAGGAFVAHCGLRGLLVKANGAVVTQQSAWCIVEHSEHANRAAGRVTHIRVPSRSTLIARGRSRSLLEISGRAVFTGRRARSRGKFARGAFVARRTPRFQLIFARGAFVARRGFRYWLMRSSGANRAPPPIL